MNITVLGAGNGAIAAAAHMTRDGHQVTMSNRSGSRLKPFLEDPSIFVTGGALPDGKVTINAVEPDITKAVVGADVIMVCVPTIGHAYYAKAIAPVLKTNQLIILNPGHMGGALQFRAELKRAGFEKSVTICETNTLSYVCRMEGQRTIGLYRIASGLLWSSLPSDSKTAELFTDLYPESKRVDNVLYTSFSNVNAVMHPPAMLLNAALIQRTNGGFKIYSEGTSPAVGILIQALDDERLKIAAALGVNLRTFLDMFYEWGYTTKEAYETGSIATAILESVPNKTIQSPPSMDHRYVHEDVGYGLVPMALIAKVIGVQTQVMDAFITLCSKINEVDYWTEGLTLRKMGLEQVRTKEELCSCIVNN